MLEIPTSSSLLRKLLQDSSYSSKNHHFKRKISSPVGCGNCGLEREKERSFCFLVDAEEKKYKEGEVLRFERHLRGFVELKKENGEGLREGAVRGFGEKVRKSVCFFFFFLIVFRESLGVLSGIGCLNSSL